MAPNDTRPPSIPDSLAFATEIARASVPLAAIVLLWISVVASSPVWTGLALLSVIAAIAAVRL
ncbi:hypothetical protein ACWESM_18770 [Nocardia sp. NPDC003999]